MIVFFLFAVGANCSTQYVIISTSKKFINYRHAANAFLFADLLRRNKIRSDDVFIGVAEDPSYISRNAYPGNVVVDGYSGRNIHQTPNVTGDLMNVKSFRALLMRGKIENRISPLRKDPNGTIVLYITGHGGFEFMKFGDVENLLASEFADIVENMKRIYSFREIVIVVDTCEASTLFDYVKTEGTTMIASSIKDEKSISNPANNDFGVPLSDQFTKTFCSLIEKLGKKATFAHLFQYLKRSNIDSTVFFKQFKPVKPLEQMKLEDYFF